MQANTVDDWSSQQPEGGSCDDQWKAAFGTIWAAAIVVTRSTARGRTRRAATVLGRHRVRHGKCGRCGSGRRAAGYRNKMVPEGRRHATSDIWTICEAALRAISVACGTRGACDLTCAGRGSAGDRPADVAVGVDDLAGAATQCRDAQRRPGLSCNDSAVACRPGGPASKTSETGGQRGAAHVCAGSVGRRGRHAKGDCDCRAFGLLERSSTWTSAGSAMGIGLESGADCSSPTARLSPR